MNKSYRFFYKGLTQIGIVLILLFLLAFTYKINQESDEYYVYADSWIHGIPSGFMGEKDGKSLILEDAWKEQPYKGDKCIKITVNPGVEAWRGLHVQFMGAWNVSLDEKTVLPDLSMYDKLEFYAKAIPGKNQDVYLIQEIGVGGGGGFEVAKFSETFLEVGENWKKYSIRLKPGELKRVNTLLYFTLPEGTLFLDEIKYVKKKK
ncbi:MAG: hypothetical protein JWO58_397 [Chitinophagaceae bacterium]|nr:hypothetical protein [Chitinophagaceae bacterium]